MDTITLRTSYEKCVEIIDAAVKEALEEAAYDGMEVSEGDIWTDMATSYLLDASEDVAREVLRCQIGFVPQQLQRVWKQRAAARRALQVQRAVERRIAAAAKRAAAAEAAREAAVQAVRSARCPKCFTVPAPSGACNC